VNALVGERGLPPAAAGSARERPDSGAPGTGRGAAPDAGESVLHDLQTLLADEVQRLRDATASESAVAWALREDGSPYVAAAAFVGGAPATPDRAAFASAARLAGATDLGARRLDPALHELARRFQCTAAAPVSAGEGRVLAVLLLRTAPPEARPRAGPRPAVAPRALGLLDASARRLARPLASALAAGRLRRLDEQVRQLDRLAALGALGAEIAHEVRNPLVSVKTFLELLPERRHDPELLGEFCEVVRSEVARLERLLDTIVEYASPQSRDPADPIPDPASVGPALDAVLGLLEHRARRSGVRLEAAAQAGLPPLCLGEDALRQVLLNLALNALDVTPQGGRVELRARSVERDVEILVSDEGPGIPPALREAVFEPFVSTRRDRPGGLGLAISRRIVEEAGGTLDIGESERGGAELRVRIPAL
jgi:signal transduction histidine kinase